MKNLLYKLLGKNLTALIKKILYQIRYCIVYPIYQYLYVRQLRQKKVINIVFIASSLSMWRYQRIYELLVTYPRFKVSIVIIPFVSYSEEQQNEDIAKLRSYFDALKISYYVRDETIFDIRKELSPNILFYPQPYNQLFSSKYNFNNFSDCLLCYAPYGFWMSKGDWSYNLSLHNCAWKLFYSTDLHKKDAQLIAYNKGRNVEVVGYTNADYYLMNKHKDVWKKQLNDKKRIIWAPHFTIFEGELVEQSNFLWMSDFMLECSKIFSDRVQFVFKPHPRLFTELCKHKEWGKEKTQAYYNEWCSRENTQLQTGEFIDLFMTSDAMIHDSGSFCVEYHYSKNPVMYVANNFNEQISTKGELGQLAMLQHYVGKTHDDIISFIEDVVIGGNDPMKCGREEFYRKYLIPPHGKTVAENTVNILLKELS